MTAIRVLVADDQAEIRAVLEALIAADAGLELAGMADGVDAAVSLAGRLRPDVALVDVKMPGGGGPCAVTGINRCSPGTRVVAFSAYGDRGSVFEMLRCGAVSYLVKGASLEEIKAALVSASRGESSLFAEVASDIVHEFSEQLERSTHEESSERDRVARVRRTLEPGALEVVFQPIVELASRDAIGFEALARFRVEPLRSPDVWFAEAAEVGLGVPLVAATLGPAIASIGTLPPDRSSP